MLVEWISGQLVTVIYNKALQIWPTCYSVLFILVSTITLSVADEISTQPSLINTGVDNVVAITGSDVGITNGPLGRYLQTAMVLTVTLWRLGGRCLIQKMALLGNGLPGLL